MNGNYEWNKQYAQQRVQQRYQAADSYLQSKQAEQASKGRGEGYLRPLLGKVIFHIYKELAAYFPAGGVQTGVEEV